MARSVLSPIALPLSKKTFALIDRRPLYARPTSSSSRNQLMKLRLKPLPLLLMLSLSLSLPLPLTRLTIRRCKRRPRPQRLSRLRRRPTFHRHCSLNFPIWACGRRSQPAIEPAPPADQPLEPGSGAPRFATHPGVRIAASEAALGVARPSAAAAGGKSDFIAAARRAAQAAGQDPKGHHAREPYKTKGGETTSARPKVVTRVKAMFLAASIVAIIIGSIQFASNILDFGIFDTKETKLVNSPEPDTANSEIAAEPAQPETSTTLADSKPAPSIAPATKAADADITASLLAPPTLPSSAPAASPPAPGSAPIQPPLSLDATAKAPPLVLNAAPSGAPPVGSPPGQKAHPDQRATSPARSRKHLSTPARTDNRRRPRTCRPLTDCPPLLVVRGCVMPP